MKKPPDPYLCLPQPPFCNPRKPSSLPSETLPVLLSEPLAITVLTHYHLDTRPITPETPTKSVWDRMLVGEEQGDQHLCLSPSVSFKATGRLNVIWSLISVYLIPGVFVPLYLSCITQVFVAMLHDFTQFMPYFLYLFDLGCIFKDLTHSSLNPQSICPLQRHIQLISEILYAVLEIHPLSCMEVRLWSVSWTCCQWHFYKSEIKMRTQGLSIQLATTCSVCSVLSLDLYSASFYYHPYPISPTNPDEFAAGWHDWYFRLILLCCLHHQIHIAQTRYCMNCWLCSVIWTWFHRKLYVPVLKMQLDHCSLETMTGCFMFGHSTEFNSLSSALCLNLVSLWACLFYGNRVCWQLDMSSAYENLCMLLHWCIFGIYCMFLLSLLICLIRGNVEVPSRIFPRPSRLRHQNHPSRSRHGVCMSSVRLVLLLFASRTPYPLSLHTWLWLPFYHLLRQVMAGLDVIIVLAFTKKQLPGLAMSILIEFIIVGSLWFSYVLMYEIIAVWTEFPVAFWFNHLQGLRRCSDEYEMHSNCAGHKFYRESTDGWTFLSKSLNRESFFVNSQVVTIVWPVFGDMYARWPNLAPFNTFCILVPLCLMASEYHRFFKPDGNSKACFPTAFGPRTYDAKAHSVHDIICVQILLSGITPVKIRFPSNIGIDFLAGQRIGVTVTVASPQRWLPDQEPDKVPYLQQMLSPRKTEKPGCTTIKKGILLKFARNRLRVQCFVIHWFPSHCFKLYHKELYFNLISLLVASEDIRCQSYISSKALYPTAFGLRTAFSYFPLYTLGTELMRRHLSGFKQDHGATVVTKKI